MRNKGQPVRCSFSQPHLGRHSEPAGIGGSEGGCCRHTEQLVPGTGRPPWAHYWWHPRSSNTHHSMFSRRSIADLMLSRWRGPTSGRGGKWGWAGEPPGRNAPGPAAGTPHGTTPTPSCSAVRQPRAGGRRARANMLASKVLRSLVETEVDPHEPQPRVREGSAPHEPRANGPG